MSDQTQADAEKAKAAEAEKERKAQAAAEAKARKQAEANRKPDETVPGGRYEVNGQIVDANGKPVKE